MERVQAYPQYVERVLGTTLEEFAAGCQETSTVQRLLTRFLEQVVSTDLLVDTKDHDAAFE